MKIAIGPKPAQGEDDFRRYYQVKSAEEMSLFDLLRLERETTALGRPITLHALDEMEDSIAAAQKGLTGAAKRLARENHPDAPWLFAVMLWAAQKGAGEDVTFEQAISIPMNEVGVIVEPGDPVDAPDPTRRPPARSGGGKPRAKDRAAKKTSRPASTPD